MHTLLLAAALNPAPFEEWVEKFDREQKETTLPIIRQHWVALGLLEETEWKLQSVFSMEGDLEDMQWRLDNITDDMPPIVARFHLPDEDTAYQNYRIGNRYERHLEAMADDFLPGPERIGYELLLKDCRDRQNLWWKVYKCQGTYFGREGRRWHLNELRKEVGEEVFYGRKSWPNALPQAAYTDPYWPYFVTEYEGEG